MPKLTKAFKIPETEELRPFFGKIAGHHAYIYGVHRHHDGGGDGERTQTLELSR